MSNLVSTVAHRSHFFVTTTVKLQKHNIIDGTTTLLAAIKIVQYTHNKSSVLSDDTCIDMKWTYKNAARGSFYGITETCVYVCLATNHPRALSTSIKNVLTYDHLKSP